MTKTTVNEPEKQTVANLDLLSLKRGTLFKGTSGYDKDSVFMRTDEGAVCVHSLYSSEWHMQAGNTWALNAFDATYELLPVGSFVTLTQE